MICLEQPVFSAHTKTHKIQQNGGNHCGFCELKCHMKTHLCSCSVLCLWRLTCGRCSVKYCVMPMKTYWCLMFQYTKCCILSELTCAWWSHKQQCYTYPQLPLLDAQVYKMWHLLKFTCCTLSDSASLMQKLTSKGCCSIYTAVRTWIGSWGRNGHQQTLTGRLKYGNHSLLLP